MGFPTCEGKGTQLRHPRAPLGAWSREHHLPPDPAPRLVAGGRIPQCQLRWQETRQGDTAARGRLEGKQSTKTGRFWRILTVFRYYPYSLQSLKQTRGHMDLRSYLIFNTRLLTSNYLFITPSFQDDLAQGIFCFPWKTIWRS